MAETSDTRARETEESKWIFSTADTCAFFGISRPGLLRWQRKGAPKFKRGKWDIQALMQWRYGGDELESSETRKLRAEADLKEAKAAQEKIKLGVTKDQFIEIDVIKAENKRLLANLKKSLLAIGHNCASALASLDPEAAEIAKNVVNNSVEDALRELSEGRMYKNGRAKKKKK